MRNKFCKILIAGLVLTAFLFSGVLRAESNSLSTYVNKNYRFRLDYPSDWQIKEKYMNAEAIFLSEQEDADDKFRENVNIAVMKVPEGTNLELIKEATLEQLKNLITDFNLAAEKPVPWAGRNAYAMVYTGTMGNYQFKWQQLFTINGDYIFVLTYSAEEKNYNKFFPYFNQIASSFSFN